MPLLLSISPGELVHAADHVAESSEQFLRLLQDMHSKQESVDVLLTVLKGIQHLLSFIGNLSLQHLTPVPELLSISKVTKVTK